MKTAPAPKIDRGTLEYAIAYYSGQRTEGTCSVNFAALYDAAMVQAKMLAQMDDAIKKSGRIGKRRSK